MAENWNQAHVVGGYTVQVTAEIKVTPQDMARWFCHLSDAEQAAFFDACGVIASDWPKPPCFQWHNIAQYTTRSGQCTIQDIADGFKGG